MKKKLSLLILFTITNYLFSQNIENKNLINLGRINLALHGAELSYETKISNEFIWENGVGIGMGSNVNGGNTEYVFEFSNPTPFFKTELKYIYNIQKRILKQKSIQNNSGNYIGFQTKYSFGNNKNVNLNKTLLTEIHWGIQRNLGRKFIFNTHIGIGYIKDFDSKDSNISPTVGVRFGYKLF